MLTLVAALDHGYAIGRAGEMLPWHLPDDLRRFKQITSGRPVVMGHRTAVSIGRALPGRDNIVLSRSRPAPFAGQIVARSLDAALAGAAGAGRTDDGTDGSSGPGGGGPGGDGPGRGGLSGRGPGGGGPGGGGPVGSGGEVIIGGGGEIYALALPLADRMRLTWVHTEVVGADTYFPRFDPAAWTEVAREHHQADARHAYAFDWVDYVRPG